mgnify:CR=1 FL=1
MECATSENESCIKARLTDIFSLSYTIYRMAPGPNSQYDSTKAINNGGNSDGDPPLPIPNREVKPVSADGTAIPSGRVGSRQPSEDNQKWLSSFFCLRRLHS